MVSSSSLVLVKDRQTCLLSCSPESPVDDEEELHWFSGAVFLFFFFSLEVEPRTLHVHSEPQPTVCDFPAFL